MSLNFTKFGLKKIAFTILITAFAIAINFLGCQLATKIIFPLFLDSLLTIAVVALCGLIPGIICAFGTNLIITVYTGSTILFSICHITTAVISWICFHRKQNNFEGSQDFTKIFSLDLFLWVGFWVSLSNAFLGNFIAEAVYKSNPVRVSANIVIQGIYMAIPDIDIANTIAGIVENLVDKMISSLLSYLFYINALKIEENFFS